MDIQAKVALAARASSDNQRALETLKTVTKNILDDPLEDKYRNISVAALSKRGLPSECFDFLYSVGFVTESDRLLLSRPRLDLSILREALVAMDGILQPHAQCQEIAQTDGIASMPSASVKRPRLGDLPGPDPDSFMQSSASPNLDADLEPAPDAERFYVESGFCSVMVKEALATTEHSEMVLPYLLSMTESMNGRHATAAQLAPTVSSEGIARTISSESEAVPDIPKLERHLSNESRHVLQQTLGHNERGAKDVARMLLSISAGVRQGVLTKQEKQDLQALVLTRQLRDVENFIIGMSICATPEMIMASGEAQWECLICYDRHDTNGWLCPGRHRFCCECMQQHIEAVAFPTCPLCEYTLDEGDLLSLNVPSSRIEAFREAKLIRAVDTLAKADECVVRCSQSACSNVVVMSSLARHRFACGICDAPDFCTRCRQSPYHYHVDCGHVQPLREQWVSWISGGREEYGGQVRTALESDGIREQALRESVLRHNELEADENWKAQHCRLCPNCNRPINRVRGCSSMICGRSYHGGDQQPGCGASFDWDTASCYTAHVERRELPRFDQATSLRGKHAFHPFTDCALCGAQGFAGLRFRCIHCPNFDVCSKCEPELVSAHQADHVFEILFESDFKCAWLPSQTRVAVVRFGEIKPRSLNDECTISDLEGLSGTVINRTLGPVEAYCVELDLEQGRVEIDLMFLEPIVSSRGEAEQLLLDTVGEDRW